MPEISSFPLTDTTSQRLERAGLEFLAEFYGVELEAHPDNIAVLSDLGHIYTQLGRLDEGLALDRRLVQLTPQCPTSHYNLSCSLSLMQLVDEALDALEAAVALGYDDAEFLEQDEDLENIRQETRFRALLRKLRQMA